MLLEVKDLIVEYDHIPALKGINLGVEKGKVTALLGSNGAGKSTLLKTISGLIKPSDGNIIYLGKNIVNESGYSIVRKGIAHCPEGRKVFPRQTVYENLKMGAYIRNDKEVEEDIKKYYELFPILSERRNQKAGFLSGGEQQMLVLCRALMSRPKLLMLDEPSMGLAPTVVKDVFDAIRIAKEGDLTILLIEQNAKQALKLADYGYILEVGKIVVADDAKSLLGSEMVKKAYLGE